MRLQKVHKVLCVACRSESVKIAAPIRYLEFPTFNVYFHILILDQCRDPRVAVERIHASEIGKGHSTSTTCSWQVAWTFRASLELGVEVQGMSTVVNQSQQIQNHEIANLPQWKEIVSAKTT